MAFPAAWDLSRVRCRTEHWEHLRVCRFAHLWACWRSKYRVHMYAHCRTHQLGEWWWTCVYQAHYPALPALERRICALELRPLLGLCRRAYLAAQGRWRLHLYP